jgi:sec-independent protein translocase protein TatB
MFDFSWSEIMLIGAVALVVIGPKDLPKALRTAGKWARKARAISREFQSSVEQMIREAELDEVRNDIKKATAVDLEDEFQKTIDPTGSLAEHLAPPELPAPAEGAPPPETTKSAEPALAAPEATKSAEPQLAAPQAPASAPAPAVSAPAESPAAPEAPVEAEPAPTPTPRSGSAS